MSLKGYFQLLMSEEVTLEHLQENEISENIKHSLRRLTQLQNMSADLGRAGIVKGEDLHSLAAIEAHFLQGGWFQLQGLIEQHLATIKFDFDDDQLKINHDLRALDISITRIVTQFYEINRDEIVQIHCSSTKTDFITTISDPLARS